MGDFPAQVLKRASELSSYPGQAARGRRLVTFYRSFWTKDIGELEPAELEEARKLGAEIRKQQRCDEPAAARSR